MNLVTRHLRTWPRQQRLAPALDVVGHIRRKTEWVRMTFQSLNFSFILTGGGEFRMDGRVWDVRAPCVITQQPGLPLEYGPTAPWPDWEELFLCYPAEQLAWFTAAGLPLRAEPVWPVREPARLLEDLRAILEALARPLWLGEEAERVDALALRAIHESVLAKSRRPVGEREQQVLRSQRFLAEHLGDRVEYAAFARRHGMSRSTLQRAWRDYLGTTPERFLRQARLRAACRLLAETALPVGEIATRVGFPDPLYFSRRFHAEMGMTATAYRRQLPIHSPG